MNNISLIGEKCTGCTTCYNICPVKAITMVKDKNGFKYPQIDDNKCINCGKCYKKCPIVSKNNIETLVNKQYYAFCTNNNKIWKNSSSGGAFTEICKSYDEFIKKNNDEKYELFIYGATIDVNMKVKHVECNIDDINVLNKSKYIQSDLGDVFSRIKNKLDANKYIVFSGTPCQVSGLKNFLGKKYDKLLLIDIACHGVGSSTVFNKCKKEVEKKYGKKLIKYEFRYKGILSTPDERHMIKYTFDDNSTKVNNSDSYMNLYLNELCLRKSCGFNCVFRNINRCSDITIADFNKKSVLLPKLYDKRNYSTIIFNSEKSFSIIDYLNKKGRLIKCSQEIIKKSNPIIFENVSKKDYNSDNLIYNNVNEINFINILNKYQRKKYYLKKYIPYSVKYLVNNLLIRRKNNK